MKYRTLGPEALGPRKLRVSAVGYDCPSLIGRPSAAPMGDEKLGAPEMVAVDGRGTLFVGFTVTDAIGRLVKR